MSKVDAELNWRPSCSLDVIHARARMYSQIRDFFKHRDVLEVETPTLYAYTNPDPMIEGFEVSISSANLNKFFLQTSPEFAMKRMLAAECGSIYQICRAYRKSESGRYHNPEFSILEWYRPGYSLHELMLEVEDLLKQVLPESQIQNNSVYLTYKEAFEEAIQLDPLSASIDDFVYVASPLGYPEAKTLCAGNRSAWLDFLFSHVVQPQLPKQSIVFVYDYPACQSALARLHPQQSDIAERVEVFIDGVELGNGFQELTDSQEQRQRFINQQQERKQIDLPVPNLDEDFLAALEFGLPDTAGIAIGLDRLLMKVCNLDHIQQVLTFPVK